MFELKKILLFTLAPILLFISETGHAAEFNPNNIISDAELQDTESLGRAEIRAFLRAKESALTDLIIADFEGKNRYASEIIFQASRNYGINPKYILVKLQKEQSLIMSKNPSLRQLDWATGYGACDACDTTDPNLEKYKGFGKQVDSATGIMRWYYDNAAIQTWIKQPNTLYDIDAAAVTPENRATAFLYTYTPHLEGNKNFWKLWNEWFQQTYPDGTIVKGNENATVYVLTAGEKRPIKNMSVLVSRFDPSLLITIPEDALTRYKTGKQISFPNYSVIRINEIYYLLDDDTARPFADHDVFRQFGYNPDEVMESTEEDIAPYAMGIPITLADRYPSGRLVRLKDSPSLYYLKNGKYYSVISPEFAAIRFPRLKTQIILPQEFELYESAGPARMPNASLIGSTLTKSVYVIENEKKRLIPSESAFINLGYRWENVRWFDDLVLSQYENGETMYADELK